MSKTYRALAVVAVVATALSLVATFTFEPGRGGWFSYAPLNPGAQFQGLLVVAANGAWQTTATIAAPIVAMFGAVVAAQARRWGWLVAFIALGLLGLYSGSALVPLALALSATWRLPNPLATSALLPPITQALPAIAALLFVATTSRPARMHSDQASEAAA